MCTREIEHEREIQMHLKIKKKYKNALVKHAFLLLIYQIKYKLIHFTANVFFANRKNIHKTGRFLLFTNKILNNNICACQIIFEKCEDYKRKIELLS